MPPFELALSRHQAGQLAEAEALYRQILAEQPDHADALHLLGLIAHQTGRHNHAVEWIRQAIALNPNNPVAYSNLGVACSAIGRLDDAVAAYRRALQLKADYPEAQINLGAALSSQGKFDEAVAAYRSALELNPGLPEAHFNLGNALKERRQFDRAIAAYRRALELKPHYPQALSNLGAALTDLGQPDAAASACRRALQLKPDYPQAHNNLGIALRDLGQLEDAVAAYRHALELDPCYADAHNNLGVALTDLDKSDEAMAACHRALQLKPHSPEAHNSLGAALAAQGRFDDAVVAYRRALELKPDFPEAHNNLGLALREQGRLDEAVHAYHRALELKPGYAEGFNNLSVAQRDQGRFDEAMAACRHALELKPGLPEAHLSLGNALRDRSRLDEAITAFRRALELKPDFAEALNNLGAALAAQGQLDEAIVAFRRILQIKPARAWAQSNLIYMLHFHPGHDGASISEEHQRWNQQFSDPLAPFLQPNANDRDPDRPLRIGYVSPDFRDHPVGRFVLPLFERHDREQFEIFCYSELARPDWMTERLRAHTGTWRNTLGVPDARLAEMIREDRVDILVDLALHTAGNRLPMFARQPAPVQVSWLGYPGSPGLQRIAYRLTDARMDPPEENPARSTEELVRLPDGWCCFQPAGDYPEVNPLPALSAKAVTFGSLNNFAKVHDGVLALWARLLGAVKGSRLLLCCPKGQTRERVRAFFSARGVAVERLELVGSAPRSDYLRLYHRIDLCLDPFPYNGMATTCDALWMGVPVLTLPGTMPISRAGLSLLTSIGLPEFAASSEDDYVRIALKLTSDLSHLANLRATLRPRMQASPLMDAPRFAQNIEAAYRSIWRRFLSMNDE